MIEKPGIYLDFPSAEYFGDPCPMPSLTQSIAKVLIEQSPAHARLEHPRLCPTVMRDEPDAERYDPVKVIGDAAHAMLIGRGKTIAEAKFDDWRKKEAKEFREANAGKVVILSKHLARAAAMVNGARAALELTDWTDAFEVGHGEVVIAWQEESLWFRSMIDWRAGLCTYDYKSTGMSVAPHQIAGMVEKMGWHVQAAMHERGLYALEPHDAGRRRFRFLAQENYPPYAVTPVELDEHWLTMGRKKLQFAIDIWRRCMDGDHWPAYPLVPITPEYPGYRETAWLNREMANDTAIAPDHLMAG